VFQARKRNNFRAINQIKKFPGATRNHKQEGTYRILLMRTMFAGRRFELRAWLRFPRFWGLA
jgi:hypothetical protein